MFIYEYRCKKCNTGFEVQLEHMKSGADVIVCPHCSSTELARVWKKTPVHYHAGDFYTHPTVHTEVDL